MKALRNLAVVFIVALPACSGAAADAGEAPFLLKYDNQHGVPYIIPKINDLVIYKITGNSGNCEAINVEDTDDNFIKFPAKINYAQKYYFSFGLCVQSYSDLIDTTISTNKGAFKFEQ